VVVAVLDRLMLRLHSQQEQAVLAAVAMDQPMLLELLEQLIQVVVGAELETTTQHLPKQQHQVQAAPA